MCNGAPGGLWTVRCSAIVTGRSVAASVSFPPDRHRAPLTVSFRRQRKYAEQSRPYDRGGQVVRPDQQLPRMRSLRSHSTTRSESLRASHLTFEQVLRNTLTSNVMIYTVGPFDEIDDQADPKRLKQLAEETGVRGQGTADDRLLHQRLTVACTAKVPRADVTRSERLAEHDELRGCREDRTLGRRGNQP
jgi:hypothetical protein